MTARAFGVKCGCFGCRSCERGGSALSNEASTSPPNPPPRVERTSRRETMLVISMITPELLHGIVSGHHANRSSNYVSNRKRILLFLLLHRTCPDLGCVLDHHAADGGGRIGK